MVRGSLDCANHFLPLWACDTSRSATPGALSGVVLAPGQLLLQPQYLVGLPLDLGAETFVLGLQIALPGRHNVA